MKTKFYFFLVLLLFSIDTIAQSGINYKAIVRDTDGTLVANQNVTVQFSILQGAAQTNVYQETHTSTTDDNGLIIVNIGEGTTDDVFADIEWSADDHFLNVQINISSGLVDLGTTQFMAVPYALNATNVNGLEAIDEGNGMGWRLIGRNPNNYGNVGLEAVDLSYNLAQSTIRGATGDYSIAMGSLTEALGTYSTAMGRNTIASEFGATAIGFSTIASGISSTALGHLTEVIGNYATAMGSQTTASGDYSTAMGSQTTASGNYSTAMGRSTTASGVYSTALGRNTTAISHSTAMGDETSASAAYSTAMGRQTTASGNNSTALGRSTIASGLNSVAIGNETEASAPNSTAMGDNTTASGNFSTAMGFTTVASGGYSTATGHFTTALGFISTAMGNRTTAPSYSETVIGRYNTNYTPNATLTWDPADRLFVIGNGTSSNARSNAMTVLKNGQHTINSSGTFGIAINSENIGINIPSSGSSGIIVTDAGAYGGLFEGLTTGVYTNSTNNNNPDLILGGNSSSNSGDNGIIASSLSYPSSDIFLRSNDAVVVQLDYDNNEAGNFIVRNGTGGNLLNIDESGNATLSGSLTQNSDRRLKKNITDLDYGLKEVLQLQPKQYFWKDKEQNKKSLGLIAQEVQPIINEIVNIQDNEAKTLGISYTELIPVLINAIQEQQDIIRGQEEENNFQKVELVELQNNYHSLLSRIEIIESKTSNE